MLTKKVKLIEIQIKKFAFHAVSRSLTILDSTQTESGNVFLDIKQIESNTFASDVIYKENPT